MCTLTTQFGITWNIVRLAGRTMFIHNRLLIVYSLEDKQYHLCHLSQNGRSIYKNTSIGECLDVSSELILDAYADAIIPRWESSYELDEQEPITERYPVNYIPNWAEAAA